MFANSYCAAYFIGKVMDVLEIKGVSKSYRDHRALHDVSFSVPEGSVYGLLGPNGAGKTTLIRIINQIIERDSGEVLLKGEPLRREHVKLIGYMPEERGLYRKMKVGEQALYLARLRGMSRADAMSELKKWFERFDIVGWWGKKVEELSKGMAQKIQFIVTVLHRPPLLIFDEPFSGFDPINANLIAKEILRLRDEGATVIFSTHDMESVEEMCDRITLIHSSENILTGTVDEVRARYSQPIYDLHYKGDPQAVQQCIPSGWQMTIGEPEEGYATAVLRQTDSTEGQGQLLAALAQVAEIGRFARRSARMKEIFIQAVADHTPSSETKEA